MIRVKILPPLYSYLLLIVKLLICWKISILKVFQPKLDTILAAVSQLIISNSLITMTIKLILFSTEPHNLKT